MQSAPHCCVPRCVMGGCNSLVKCRVVRYNLAVRGGETHFSDNCRGQSSLREEKTERSRTDGVAQNFEKSIARASNCVR